MGEVVVYLFNENSSVFEDIFKGEIAMKLSI